jgi:hypothetical protein
LTKKFKAVGLTWGTFTKDTFMSYTWDEDRTSPDDSRCEETNYSRSFSGDDFRKVFWTVLFFFLSFTGLLGLSYWLECAEKSAENIKNIPSPPSQEQIKDWIKGLRTENTEACSADVRRLSSAGIAAVEPLIFSLRCEVVYILTDADNVVMAIPKKEKNFHYGVVRALIEIGQPAVDLIVKELRQKDPWASEDFTYILGEIGGKKAIKALREAMDYKSPTKMGTECYTCRKSAIAALAKLGVTVKDDNSH